MSAINAAPVALAGALTTNEDTPATGILVATDADSASVPRTIVANAAGVGTAAVTDLAIGAFAYALETDAILGADDASHSRCLRARIAPTAVCLFR